MKTPLIATLLLTLTTPAHAQPIPIDTLFNTIDHSIHQQCTDPSITQHCTHLATTYSTIIEDYLSYLNTNQTNNNTYLNNQAEQTRQQYIAETERLAKEQEHQIALSERFDTLLNALMPQPETSIEDDSNWIQPLIQQN